jgi:hypothetical protein
MTLGCNGVFHGPRYGKNAGAWRLRGRGLERSHAMAFEIEDHNRRRAAFRLRALLVICHAIAGRREHGLKFRFSIACELSRLSVKNEPHFRIADFNFRRCGACERCQDEKHTALHTESSLAYYALPLGDVGIASGALAVITFSDMDTFEDGAELATY